MELKQTLKEALARKQRWNDEEYLTRIVFCEMIKGDESNETGFGIGTVKHSDLNYPLLTVDCDNQTVKEEGKKWSFDDFCKDEQIIRNI